MLEIDTFKRSIKSITIKNAGKLYVYDCLKDDSGIRNTRKFLECVLKRFIKYSYISYLATEEFPFVYSEKQIHSVLLPAIARTSEAIISEQPIKRKKKKKIHHGWVDYWVLYNSTSFVIEVKHSWQCMNKNCIRDSTKTRWESAKKQIKNIKRTEINDLNVSKNLVKLALIIVPTYCSSSSKEKIHIPDKETQIECFYNTLSQLKQPKWSAMWKLKDKIVKTDKYGKKYEIHPSVIFFVHVKH